MTTRKEFCQSCLVMAVAGLGAAPLFGRADEPSGEKKMIAACGLTCSACPAFIATRKNDDALRQETARKWSEMFKSDIKPEDINCDGCPSGSDRIFNYCRVCGIRACSREKKVETCAACAGYPCQKLSDFLTQAPEAKATLEALRQTK
jgi:hypothetical protein